MRMRSEAGPVAERSGAMAASGGGGQRWAAVSGFVPPGRLLLLPVPYPGGWAVRFGVPLGVYEALFPLATPRAGGAACACAR